jgi:hypothetical protein
MTRTVFWAALLLILTATIAGCSSWNLGPWGGPAYTLDTEKIGTGQQAITPRNDAFYQNGEPMDYRSRR